MIEDLSVPQEVKAPGEAIQAGATKDTLQNYGTIIRLIKHLGGEWAEVLKDTQEEANPKPERVKAIQYIATVAKDSQGKVDADRLVQDLVSLGWAKEVPEIMEKLRGWAMTAKQERPPQN